MPTVGDPRTEAGGGERLAPSGDVRLQHPRGRGRRVVAPEVVHQCLEAHDLAGAEREHGEQRAAQGSTWSDLAAAGGDLEGTEHRHGQSRVHGRLLAGPHGPTGLWRRTAALERAWTGVGAVGMSVVRDRKTGHPSGEGHVRPLHRTARSLVVLAAVPVTLGLFVLPAEAVPDPGAPVLGTSVVLEGCDTDAAWPTTPAGADRACRRSCVATCSSSSTAEPGGRRRPARAPDRASVRAHAGTHRGRVAPWISTRWPTSSTGAAGGVHALRTDLRGEAKADGDKALAKEIGALGKPSAAAWVANLLVRDHREEIENLVELGRLLREAQENLEGDQLRALDVQRRQLVSALTRQARALANQRGHPVSSAVAAQVEETLRAAMSDPEAGEALLPAGSPRRCPTAAWARSPGRPLVRRPPAAREAAAPGKAPERRRPAATPRREREEARRAAEEKLRRELDEARRRSRRPGRSRRSRPRPRRRAPDGRPTSWPRAMTGSSTGSRSSPTELTRRARGGDAGWRSERSRAERRRDGRRAPQAPRPTGPATGPGPASTGWRRRRTADLLPRPARRVDTPRQPFRRIARRTP